ncbi:MAG: dihydropteroate synthase, partial [Steroidobacteraceae bacterium]
AAGIAAERIALDPGFGFGKNLQHNLELLAGLPRITGGAYPVLIGLSRKSMLSRLTGRPVDQRLAGSLALHTIGTLHGARIVRAHDVAETRDAVAVAWAVRQGGAG